MRTFIIILLLFCGGQAFAQSRADSLRNVRRIEHQQRVDAKKLERKVRRTEREQMVYIKELERKVAKGDSISVELLAMARKADSLTSSAVQVDSVVIVDDENIPTLERAWMPVVVDHHIGVRGGWGFGSMRREPARANVDLPFSLWNFGITYHFDVPAQKFVGCIEVGLGVMEKGYAYKFSSDGDLAEARKYTVIELPILWQPYIPFGKGGSRFYLSAGPFLSYTIGGTEYLYNSADKEVVSENKYVYDIDKDYFWGYGVTVGGGFVIAIKSFAISAEFRYSIGLSDILKGPEFVTGNPFRTPVDQMSVSLGVRYKFSTSKKRK